MKNIIAEIKNILLEKSNKPDDNPASNSIETYSKKLEQEIGNQKLNAPVKKQKSKKASGVGEDDDIISNSKKDLASKEDSQEEKSSDKVKTPDESPSTINLADAQSFEKLIDILNQFRAAHSFTDEEVSSRLSDYFDSLEREEKEVLHVLIKGLVQITVLDVSGKEAYTPSKLMFRINKTGAASSERKKSIERKIDKKGNEDKEENQSKDKKQTKSGLPIITIGAGVNESTKNKKELIDIVQRNNV